MTRVLLSATDSSSNVAVCSFTVTVSCALGFERAGSVCAMCTEGTFKDEIGDAACGQCGEGYYCALGATQEVPCLSAEGFYCPPGFSPSLSGVQGRRRNAGILQGVECPIGYYCAGLHAPAVPCTAAEGFYCPSGFAPINSDVAETTAQALGGIRCPPSMYCAGQTAPPTVVPQALLCDLSQACFASDQPGSNCNARQSTFHKFNDPPASYAVDSDPSTCMKTAEAPLDPAPQWVRVDLGQERLIGMVRFFGESSSSSADFTVAVTEVDATLIRDENQQVVQNPSLGGAIPPRHEACTVEKFGDRMFEATCKPATKGRFVFISRAFAQEVLVVCDVSVFEYECLGAEEEMLCGIGYEPSGCASLSAPSTHPECKFCVPCRPGYFKDFKGNFFCTQCPGVDTYGRHPYSPEGSTSMFQCEGTQFLLSASTLEVTSAAFDQTVDSWKIEIAFTLASRVAMHGVSTLFMSKGGTASPSNDDTFRAQNFPCRVDHSVIQGEDRSVSLGETLCCLQSFRADYITTETFRKYSDELDLVAANDKCDGEDSSKMLERADHEIIGTGANGTHFVDSNGDRFSQAIRVHAVAQGGFYGTTKTAVITIPDSELFLISRGLQSNGGVTDSREIFIGLFDLLPTGTRVVDFSVQQISVVLTRTRYGSFASFGRQNIDNTFISKLSGRVHQVFRDNESVIGHARTPAALYVELSFVWDSSLHPVSDEGPVLVQDLTIDVGNGGFRACNEEPTNFYSSVTQECGPSLWDEDTRVPCPQVFIPEDHFGRVYVPLDMDEASDNSVRIKFQLLLKDSGGNNATLDVNMDVVISDYVSWCGTATASISLSESVLSSIIIGSESDMPARVFSTTDQDFNLMPTTAESLQDGLITLTFELDATQDVENLEVFLEDVLVIHVNPGAITDVHTILNNPQYLPTYEYDPDTRKASLVIPEDLKSACPAEDETPSFFGCVHKHVVQNKQVVMGSDAYFLGQEGPSGAQDFMQSMLGSTTAAVAARELGHDYEAYLNDESSFFLSSKNPRKVGLWINPGHKWASINATSQYSLSQHVVIFTLYGVRAGAETPRRVLAAGGRASRVAAVKYNVSPSSIVESILNDAVAIEVQARMAFEPLEICLPKDRLKEVCGSRLHAAVSPHASKVLEVHCISVDVDQTSCESERRLGKNDAVGVVEALLILKDTPSVFIYMQAVVDGDKGILEMKSSDGSVHVFSGSSEKDQLPRGVNKNGDVDPDSRTLNTTLAILVAVGAALTVVTAICAAWKTYSKCTTSMIKPVPEEVKVVARIDLVLFGPHVVEQGGERKEIMF
eukprot:76669-Rhodomonas_salina.1